MAEQITEAPTQADPSQSKSALDVGVVESNAAEEMFGAIEKSIQEQQQQNQRVTTEPDKAPEPVKEEPKAEAKLPPPIKVKREPAPEPTNKPPDLTDDDLQKLPYDKWPRTAQQWKEAKDLAERQINHYQGEINKWKERAKSGGPEVAEIVKERDELRNELRSIAVERDPQFRQKYDTAFSAVRDHLESVLSKDDVDKALSIFDQKPGVKRTDALEEFTKDLSPIKQSAITAALLDHDKTVRMRDHEIGEARKNWDKIQIEQRAQGERQERERTQQFEKAFDAVVKEWTDEKEGYEFMRRTGKPDADKDIDETVELARGILSGNNTPDEMARAAMYAAMSPRILQAYIDSQTKIMALEKQLKSLKSSSPTISGAQSTPSAEGDIPPDGSDYGTAIAKIAASMGLTTR